MLHCQLAREEYSQLEAGTEQRQARRKRRGTKKYCRHVRDRSGATSQNRKINFTKYLYNDQQIQFHFRIDYQTDDLNEATAEVDQKLYFRVVTPDSFHQTYENDMAQPRQARFDSGTTGDSKKDGGNRLWSTW